MYAKFTHPKQKFQLQYNKLKIGGKSFEIINGNIQELCYRGTQNIEELLPSPTQDQNGSSEITIPDL